jgi:hypothetical protein
MGSQRNGNEGLLYPRGVAACLALFATTMALLPLGSDGAGSVRPSAQTARPLDTLRSIAAREGIMPAPVATDTAFVSSPRPLTAEQIAASQVATDKLYPTWAARRALVVPANAAAGPAPGTEVVPEGLVPPAVPSSSRPFARLLDRLLPVAPSTFGLAVRMVAEPAIALGDSVIWMTGNWFAARSTDHGATWQYVDPYADFPTFTSDQDAVFDPHRHLFVWYRQGGLVPGLQENSS